MQDGNNQKSIDKSNKNTANNTKVQSKTQATENLVQPVKFVATMIQTTFSKMPKYIQVFTFLIFICLFVLFFLASMKQLCNFDPLAVFAKETIKVRGELLVNKTNKLEKNKYVSLEIETNKEFYTKKEWIGDSKFRLLWIMLIRPNELQSGAIDFEIKCLNGDPIGIEPISAQLHFSEFYNPKNPWQWKLLKIEGGKLSVDTYQTLKNQ